MDDISEKLPENRTWIYVVVGVVILVILVIIFWPRSKDSKGLKDSKAVRPTRIYDYDTDRVEVGPTKPSGSSKERPKKPSYSISRISQAPVYQVLGDVTQVPPPPQPKDSGVSQTRRGSKGELACRKALEEIYGQPFPSDWPSWLINPKTGAGMELDCYNEKLKIALEYHGRQHYEFVPFFHKTRENFEALQERDRLKLDILQEKGIYLITVPYTVKLEDIKEYIIYYLPHNRAARLESGLTN